MTVFRLSHAPGFPDPELAEPDGLLAVGGDLSPARLLQAYALGIFPWYGDGEPVLWWSPDPRLVLQPARMRVSRSLRKTLRSGRYEIRSDTAFEQVIDRCSSVPRPGQSGTWITADMRSAYVELHRLGFAHSVESWEGAELAGGLYGVSLGGCFFGESMFALQPDASKVALSDLAAAAVRWGFDLIDCQLPTAHLLRLGAELVRRREFLARLERSLSQPTRRGSWTEEFARR